MPNTLIVSEIVIICIDKKFVLFLRSTFNFFSVFLPLHQFYWICVPWMQSSNAKQPHRKFIISYNFIRQTQKMFIFRWPKPKCNLNIQTRAQNTQTHTHTDSLNVWHTVGPSWSFNEPKKKIGYYVASMFVLNSWLLHKILFSLKHKYLHWKRCRCGFCSRYEIQFNEIVYIPIYIVFRCCVSILWTFIVCNNSNNNTKKTL